MEKTFVQDLMQLIREILTGVFLGCVLAAVMLLMVPAAGVNGEENEQQAAEETFEEILELPITDLIPSGADPAPAGENTITPHTEEAAAAADVRPVLYSVSGSVLAEEIQVYLYNALAAREIGWFMPYAVMIAFQESSFNIYAVSRDGRDQGLFQYRVEFFEGLNPFNPYEEIEIFADQMASRAAAGCDIETMISRHKQSDWGPYDQVYVNQVMRWASSLEQY